MEVYDGKLIKQMQFNITFLTASKLLHLNPSDTDTHEDMRLSMPLCGHKDCPATLGSTHSVLSQKDFEKVKGNSLCTDLSETMDR